MIAREIQAKVRQCLSQYPAVALVGPRQSGKTTLARLLSDNYFDLEQAADRLKLDLQWENIIKRKQLIILDEAQTHPDLFPRLRGAIDNERKRCNRFLLLGSVSPWLMTQVSESLAGRLAVVELTRFCSKNWMPKPPGNNYGCMVATRTGAYWASEPIPTGREII